MGSAMTLMDDGGRSNLQPPIVSDYPPTWSTLTPPFTLLVPVPDRRHKFLLCHLADASAHVAASRVFGNILIEATTCVE